MKRMPLQPGRARRCPAALRLLAVLWLGCASQAAIAWVYPEHRELALLAVQQLDAQRRTQFDRLWQQARGDAPKQLCASGADAQQGLAPHCLDWAALSAIAGDHSCSSREMFDSARSAAWLLRVADVGAQLKVDLARVPVTAPADAVDGTGNAIGDARRRFASEAARAERINALRVADNRLQLADPEYATRASQNGAHFLLARPSTDIGLFDYAALALSAGSEISAIGVYASLHLSALQKASRLAHEPLAPAERDALARAMLADEAFALHFMQDMYASGHIAGTWGDASQRQGTHDFYNANGLEVFTWSGGSRTMVLMGDARMRPEDAQVAAANARISLQQVLDVAAGRAGGPQFPHTPKAPAEPDDFDVCRNNVLPRRAEGLAPTPAAEPVFVQALSDTPVPGLGPGLGAMPRSRSEVGPFVGLAGSIDVRGVSGGFAPGQTRNGAIGGLDLSVRAGVGMDGVMGEAGDGLVFGSIGLRADTPSSNRYGSTADAVFGGSFGAAIPARTGLSLRLRMPFYLVPGDLLLLSPLFFFDRDAYTRLAVTAGNGGLIPWQAGLATPIGRFQFVLGRELGATLYNGHYQLVAPGTGLGAPSSVLNFKSTFFDLPVLEYRPYRSFSSNQSSSLLTQLFIGADVPYGESVAFPPGAAAPSLGTVWSIGLRLVFDWRYYY